MSIKKPHLGKITDRLISLIEEISSGNVSKFAKKSGVPQQTLHNYTKGRIPSGEQLYNICSNLGVNTNWLLTGEGEMFRRESESIGTLENVVDLQHAKLVHGFKNKELAKQINQCLLEIEELNENGLQRAADKLEGILEGLKLASDKDREIADLRRQLAASEARSRSRDPDAAANES